jgi:large subunit ribosomal protein L30
MKKVRITQVKSTIRTLPMHRENMAALGLRGIGKSVEKTLNPAIEGMLRRVAHLVKVEEV